MGVHWRRTRNESRPSPQQSNTTGTSEGHNEYSVTGAALFGNRIFPILTYTVSGWEYRDGFGIKLSPDHLSSAVFLSHPKQSNEVMSVIMSTVLYLGLSPS